MVSCTSRRMAHLLLSTTFTLTIAAPNVLAQSVTTPEAASAKPVQTAAVIPAAPAAFPATPTNTASTDGPAITSDKNSAPALPVQPEKTVPAPCSDAVANLPGVSTTVPNNPTIILIDNDDEKALAEVEQSYQWQEIPDAAGTTKIVTGARFPVKVVSELCSKTAKVGDAVEGRSRVDLKIGGKLIAPKGSRVVGHVFSVMPARRILVAELSPKRWWRANGEIGIQFDEMINAEGEHLPLVATPARASRIVDNKYEGRVMGVNKKGEVASPLSIQLKAQAVHLVIRTASEAGGMFTMGAVPVAYACLGAINPSLSFMHPVGKNVPHRRLKGAAMGFVEGLPGGFLISDSVIKGQEASIKPGDEFLVEFKQDFTGEPGGDAEMMGNGSKDVHGEVVRRAKKNKKS